MRIAIIEDGLVSRVISGGEDWQEVFPDIVGVASDTANVGDLWDGTAFAPPPAPPPTINDLKTYAGNKRWSVETGGIVVEGIPIATDDRSKIMITGARIAAQADAGFTTSWVVADGTVHDLDAEQIIAISDAVLAHVSAAFATYSAVISGINAQPQAITTVAEIDAASWPANV